MIRRVASCAALLCAAFFASGDEPPPELLDLAKQLRAKDAKTRLRAAEALRDKGKDAAPVARELCDAIATDGDKQVVGACLGALERARPDLYRPVSSIRPAVGTAHLPAVHGDLRAIAKLGEAGRPATGFLVAACKRADKTEDAYEILKALAAVKPDDAPTAAYCKSLLGGKFGFPEALDVYAGWAVGDAKNDKELIAAIRPRLAAGLKWVEQMGPRAKPLLPDLKKLANSADEKTRAAALKAVERVEAEK